MEYKIVSSDTLKGFEKDRNPYQWTEKDAKFLLNWYGDWVQNDLEIRIN